jgi:uncharacterized protein (DUF924 family)
LGQWPRSVICLWLDEVGCSRWLGVVETQFDSLIRECFESLYEAWAMQSFPEALASPERALATFIVLDQFPCNVYRRYPQAFQHDKLAHDDVAAEGGARGVDRNLGRDERLFFYLPFEHREDIDDHERAVALIGALGDDEYTRFTIAHRDAGARFKRGGIGIPAEAGRQLLNFCLMRDHGSIARGSARLAAA